jgi:hypothetical protein
MRFEKAMKPFGLFFWVMLGAWFCSFVVVLKVGPSRSSYFFLAGFFLVNLMMTEVVKKEYERFRNQREMFEEM